MRPTSSVLRPALLSAVAIVAVLGLAGCVDAAPNPSPTSARPTPTATATPTVPATDPAEELGSLEVACADLVDPDAVYAFDPNFALVGGFDPDPGTAAARALTEGGVVCRWVRETGDITIDLSAARLPNAELTALKDEAFASSEMVPTYGDEAYFDPETGTATVFQGSVWLVITSPAFAEPGEATQIIDSALAVLATL